ncbi:hypothetical protein CYMTET_49180, partial [Cymbomonas tetramitiformis]
MGLVRLVKIEPMREMGAERHGSAAGSRRDAARAPGALSLWMCSPGCRMAVHPTRGARTPPSGGAALPGGRRGRAQSARFVRLASSTADSERRKAGVGERLWLSESDTDRFDDWLQRALCSRGRLPPWGQPLLGVRHAERGASTCAREIGVIARA